MNDKGQVAQNQTPSSRHHNAEYGDFVLEKTIFSNIFDKDIRRVFVYKKAERLAKVVHLVAPAFAASASLKDKIDRIAVGLVEAAILQPALAREALSRELLALSSVLAIARTGSLLSAMNAELIGHEAHELLQEVAAYEEPRFALEAAPTLAELAKTAGKGREQQHRSLAPLASQQLEKPSISIRQSKGHMSDNTGKLDRKEAVLAILRAKGPLYIKDISTVIRDVSEKTVQRELQALVEAGIVTKTGERRWTSYRLAS
jgi:DNA-binding transcriptional ArsR family regulator